MAFTKNCANYSFTAAGRDILATLVTVPELDGTFIEIETLTADPDDVGPAIAAVRAVLDELGIASADLTTELYTDAVMRIQAEGLDGRSGQQERVAQRQVVRVPACAGQWVLAHHGSPK